MSQFSFSSFRLMRGRPLATALSCAQSGPTHTLVAVTLETWERLTDWSLTVLAVAFLGCYDSA